MAVAQSNDDDLRHILQLLKDAAAHYSNGDFEKAEAGYLQALGYGYHVADILPVLARIVAKGGALERAIGHWKTLLELKPNDLEALIEMGALLHRLGRAGEAVECFAIARSIAPENELVLSNLAVALADSGQHHEAFVEFRRVAARQPGNIHVRHQMRRLASRMVPFWHIPMLNDVRRNDAFERAICRAVEKEGRDARILDIGTGSGLLSMMAARAGAANIVTCERVPVIAETAERIVALNGYEKQIRIVNKNSDQLVIGEDLEERADILISEILSSDLLAEDVLSAFEDAHARLLRQGATIIPRAATAVGCLVESDILANYAFVDRVSGFDVSPFSALSTQHLPVHGTMTSWRRLSQDTDLVRIDLTEKEHKTGTHRLSISVLEDGVAVGIVQWMSVDLAEGIAFSNHPDDYSDGGWLQVLHTFPQPISVIAGEHLDVIVGYDRNSLIVMPVPRSPNDDRSKMTPGGLNRRDP